MVYIVDDKRFGGVIFVLLSDNNGLHKFEAERRAKVYRKKGYFARLSKSKKYYFKGRYDVYIRSKNFEASANQNPNMFVKYAPVDRDDGYPVIKWTFYIGHSEKTIGKWYT